VADQPSLDQPRWRVGEHYGIHVYEGDRPVATFLTETDARMAVIAVNRLMARKFPETLRRLAET